MAEMAANVGQVPRTINANGALARGLRCTLNSSGTCDLSAIGVRGDYITAVDIPALSAGVGYPTGGGGKVPAVASVAVAVGDPAYSAAAGQFSNVSTGAVLMGKWVLAASGAGVLGEVELESAA